MGHEPAAYSVKAHILLLAMLICSGGCSQSHDDNNPMGYEQRRQWSTQNPCGVLQITKPLYNVTGELSTPTANNNMVHLFLTRNDSIDAAFYIVENCKSLGKVETNRKGNFNFPNLPAGNYIAMISSIPFGNTPVFPIIHGVNDSNHIINRSWYGMNDHYSLTTFSLQT